MNPRLIKRAACNKCQKETDHPLWRQMMQNGEFHFYRKCSICEAKLISGGRGLYIAKALIEAHLSPAEIEEIPIDMPTLYSRCARCGGRKIENHHWAPRALFTDADKWPQDNLCTNCHTHWHSIVTPGLVWHD